VPGHAAGSAAHGDAPERCGDKERRRHHREQPVLRHGHEEEEGAARNLDLVRQTHDPGRGSLLDVGDVAIVLGLGRFAAVVFRDPRWFEPPRRSR
jgi:hypothetical protein